ncbi:MAG: hypothetical protein PUI48_10350 [Oscillospiraceae bacterium]|nr:hypothetical protein [Oscillospiraceae bacterium]MDY6208103.1 hypothetical protein [Oscillospiraceae bacterium]
MPRYDRISYEKLFDKKPPVSYDELTESGGYAVLVPENEYCFAGESEQISAGDTLTLRMIRYIYVSVDEYERLPEDERKGIVAIRGQTEENNEPLYYIRYENNNNDYYISAVGTSEKAYAELEKYGIYMNSDSEKYVILVRTLDTYDRVADEY